MWGALAGAVVGAAGAWLFALDLRRRDKEDRQQEREQTKADREAERAQDRLSREAEREQDRQFRLAERAEEDQAQYDLRMMREWPRVIQAISDYASAEREIRDATRAGLPPPNGRERHNTAAVTLIAHLNEVAMAARGEDHEVVNSIGVLAVIGPPHSEEHTGAMDRVGMTLSVFATSPPDRRPTTRKNLLGLLKRLLNGEKDPIAAPFPLE